MIKIGLPRLEAHGGRVRLSADIDLDGEKHPLWFEVDEKYGQYLCPERSDAYVLGLLHYAMRFGHDIVCAAPMSRRLYEQLVGQFLAAFYKVNGEGCYHVAITCELADEIEHIGRGAIGTGVSCGVDSLHVFASHPDITHACIWNGHGVDPKETVESRKQAWENIRGQAARFAARVGVELIEGNTNFDRGCLPRLQWDGMTTQGNLFCVFALQKLWSKYYVASDCAADNFKMKLPLTEDPAHYEFFLFPFVSMERIMIQMDGADCRRVEKVQDLVSYEPAWDFLNTCWGIHDGHRNCSYLCPKCMRTMLALYCHDALDKFTRVYDVAYFNRHLDQYLAEYYRGCLHKDFFATELTPYLRLKSIPASVKLGAMFIVAKKLIRKVMHRGRVKYFRPD